MNLKSVMLNLMITTLLSGISNDLLAMNHQNDLCENAKHNPARRQKINNAKKPTKNTQGAEKRIASIVEQLIDENMLGLIYETGYGVDKNYNSAFEHYKKASAKGSSLATFNLGRMYENGLGVQQNSDQAIKYYEKAMKKDANSIIKYVQKGTPDMQFALGRVYEYGYGIAIDCKKAMRFYKEAAESGECPIALCSVGLLLESEKCGTGDIKQAFEYYKRGAKLNEPNALWNLGALYEEGVDDFLEKDIERAKSLYVEAAEQLHGPAQASLGNIYRKEKKYTEAIQMYQLAANQGNPFGQYNLGYMYENGLGTSINYETAQFWYQKSADQNHALSYCALGFIQHRGLAGRASVHLANKNYTQAMEIDSEKIIDLLTNGNDDDMYVMGYIYQNGLGTTADIQKANELFKLAADHGNKYAIDALAQYKNESLDDSLTVSANYNDMEIECKSPNNEKLPSLADYYNLNFTIPENTELTIQGNFYDDSLVVRQQFMQNDQNITIDPNTNETIAVINLDDDVNENFYENSDTETEESCN